MKPFSFICLCFLLLTSCHKKKDDPVTATQDYLKENTNYVSSALHRTGKLRLFTHDGEIFNQAIMNRMYAKAYYFFSVGDTTTAYVDTIKVATTKTAIIYRYYRPCPVNVSYSSDNITLSMVDSQVYGLSGLVYDKSSREYVRDSAFKTILDMDFLRGIGFPVFMGNDTFYSPIFRQTEKAIFKNGKITHPVTYCYYISPVPSFYPNSYTSSQILFFGVRANPVPLMGLNDTIVIQEGTIDYIPR